jgi:hypothetical protein
MRASLWKSIILVGWACGTANGFARAQDSAPNAEPQFRVITPTDEEVEEFRNALRRHLRIGLGYVHSSWHSFSPAIANGSMALEMGASRHLTRQLEGGLRALFLTGTDGSSGDNVYAMSFGGELRYLFGEQRFTPFVGGALSFANYRAWSVAEETPASIRYDKHASGASLGLTPMAGYRLRLSPWSAVELAAAYEFFANDAVASKAGGPGLYLSFLFGRLGDI